MHEPYPCGKAVYTQADAERRARRARAAKRGKDSCVDALHAYPCRKCGGWHIGHRPHVQADRENQRRAAR